MMIRGLYHNEPVPMDLLLLADPSERLINNYLERGKCMVAEQHDKIIGVYVVLPTRPDTAELVNISVEEAYHGKGIGKQLVYHAVKWAKYEKFKTLEVGTGNSSIDQLAFYQKCGFRITGIDLDFFIRHYEDDIYENGIQCRDMIRLSMEL